MAEHNDFGKLAEELAKSYLQEKGYIIKDSNFRYQKAEIDIIASSNSQIIMVEVKARASDAFLEPHEAVNRKKIRLIVTAADEYMKKNNLEEEVRFDIISVLPDATGKLEITHIESAFEAMDAN
ncbi:YraN family protein [Chryseobacterium sp. cx-311]|uniref:YraN family protein n=1 Tax=Marnyiella aurantia TaxID=2758037 RepID=UPI001AE11FA3|nr:YraN family protein [Marnyiella aurantia]MBP0612290.1 YraN family protein [Marnyiella aurantia]